MTETCRDIYDNESQLLHQVSASLSFKIVHLHSFTH